MTCNIDELESCGISTTTGIGYTGSREKYIQALKKYYKSYESNCARVAESLAAMNIEDYTIIVHSLKSNSRMIGAAELSSRFEALEMAAISGDTSLIIADTPSVLSSYDALTRMIKPYCEADETSAVEKITADEARRIADELLEALDEYDDELSASLASKLSGFPFEDSQRNMLVKASEYIDDFMYDEAADIIRKISAAIV